MARAARQTYATIIIYGAMILSIVLAATSPPPESPVGTAIQSVGLIFQDSLTMFQEFNEVSSLPSLALAAIYAVVGMFLWWVTAAIFVRYSPEIVGDFAALIFGFLSFVLAPAAVFFGVPIQFMLLGGVLLSGSLLVSIVP